MGSVIGGATDVAYRAGSHRHHLAEAQQGRRADRLSRLPLEDALDELLGLTRPDGRRRRRAQAGSNLSLFRVESQAEGAHGDHHRVAGADLGELLRAFGLRSVKGRYKLVWFQDRSEEHTSELQSRQYLVC